MSKLREAVQAVLEWTDKLNGLLTANEQGLASWHESCERVNKQREGAIESLRTALADDGVVVTVVHLDEWGKIHLSGGHEVEYTVLTCRAAGAVPIGKGDRLRIEVLDA